MEALELVLALLSGLPSPPGAGQTPAPPFGRDARRSCGRAPLVPRGLREPCGRTRIRCGRNSEPRQPFQGSVGATQPGGWMWPPGGWHGGRHVPGRPSVTPEFLAESATWVPGATVFQRACLPRQPALCCGVQVASTGLSPPGPWPMGPLASPLGLQSLCSGLPRELSVQTVTPPERREVGGVRGGRRVAGVHSVAGVRSQGEGLPPRVPRDLPLSPLHWHLGPAPPPPAQLSVSLQVAQNRAQRPQEERHPDPGL